jgi:hypothetical protein
VFWANGTAVESCWAIPIRAVSRPSSEVLFFGIYDTAGKAPDVWR